MLNKKYILASIAIAVSIASNWYTYKNISLTVNEFAIGRQNKIQETIEREANKRNSELTSQIRSLLSVDIKTTPLSIILKEIYALDSTIVVTGVEYNKPSNATPTKPVTKKKDTSNVIETTDDTKNSNTTSTTSTNKKQIKEDMPTVTQNNKSNEIFISLRGNVRELLPKLDSKFNYKVIKYGNYDNIETAVIRIRR